MLRTGDMGKNISQQKSIFKNPNTNSNGILFPTVGMTRGAAF